MKFKNLHVVITACVVVCVLAAIGVAMVNSMEADMAMTLPLEIVPTEFSSDGGQTWQPMGSGEAFARQRSSVAVRGHFNFDIMDGWSLNMNFSHMQMEMLVNGEMVASYAREFREIRPEWCTDIWICFQLPEISTTDLVELRLYSLHPSGAKMGAYAKALSSITLGEPFYVYQKINAQNGVNQYVGLALMIVGIVLFCIAFVALWMKSPLQKIMMYTALFAVGEGLFWLADAAEIAHYANNSIVFFSTGRYVSRMLCSYALISCIAALIRGKTKFIAQGVAYASGVLSIAFLAHNMTGLVNFCKMEQLWYTIQLLLLSSSLVCCLWEMASERKGAKKFLSLLTMSVACSALLFDLGTIVLGWHSEMVLSKWACAAAATIHAASLLLHLPASYAAIRQAEKLTEELHNSRIVLAMSQIRTHFIFNVLNAVSSLCKSDPELADMELVRFSRYLRTNIDIMQDDHPIPFEKALEHMHNYVDLEQMRFGDKIILDETYEFTQFVIPPLVLQPLVENAIKHGLLPRAEGGIIRVNTCRRGDEALIEIADNGIGFDTRKRFDKGSVGLSNVRFRVERMMNGRMQVESTPGTGTVVRLWLPLGKEESSSTLSM